MTLTVLVDTSLLAGSAATGIEELMLVSGDERQSNLPGVRTRYVPSGLID
jgi:hypothetical protein